MMLLFTLVVLLWSPVTALIHPLTPCLMEQKGAMQTHAQNALLTEPVPGVFIPECTLSGEYRKQQCYLQVCWCVDPRGRLIPGTRTYPWEDVLDCNKPCLVARIRNREDSRLTGRYVPQCTETGDYERRQCHPSTGHCWCVDAMGQEIEGTRVLPGEPKRKCHSSCATERERLQKDPYRLGMFVPQCTPTGEYEPMQCHGSTGHCWCVDAAGQEIEGSRVLPGETIQNCKKPCVIEREALQDPPMPGQFVPTCTLDGEYEIRQCHGSTGHCWCVDAKGQEIHGTRKRYGEDMVDCHTNCLVARERPELNYPYPSPGQFIPRCTADGRFEPRQCHGSTNMCWCVDEDGHEIPGTRAMFGRTSTGQMIDCHSMPLPPTTV